MPPAFGSTFPGTIILGRPTAGSIALNLLASCDLDAYVEYGQAPGNYLEHTGLVSLQKDQPLEVDLTGLTKDTRYYYRVCHRVCGESAFVVGTTATFRTQRPPGSGFNFGIQGDSHPERPHVMFNAELYRLTMNNVKAHHPDFYIAMGDEFSVDVRGLEISQQAIDHIYAQHRDFFGIMGTASPLFLVNGNHEQAAKYLLNGTPHNPAVYAGKSRLKFYSLPAPDTFYTGDTKPVDHIGLLRDYYAWTWGDALFVVIDFYWHSAPPVDNVFGAPGGKAGAGSKWKNKWDFTLGETQYQWFKQTLESAETKYKFVITHHVLGTGRGGIELAGQFEWGGRNEQGIWEFDKMRPEWALPIHQLMVKNGVTIFFQGHDHLYCRQELDGVIYQSVPIPADFSYTAFNSESYKTGITLPNAGFLNVTVSPAEVRVDYISSYLPKDEQEGKQNGQVAYSYTIYR